MEATGKKAVILLGLMVAIDCCADAQTICNMTYSELMACKPATTPPNLPRPTSDCCVGLSHADLKCFCQYKNSTILPSIGVDPNLAMELPSKCKIPNVPPADRIALCGCVRGWRESISPKLYNYA